MDDVDRPHLIRAVVLVCLSLSEFFDFALLGFLSQHFDDLLGFKFMRDA